MSTTRRGFRNSRGLHRTRGSSHSASLAHSLSAPDKEIRDGLLPTAISKLDVPKDLTSQASDDIKITNLEFIGSYNWVNGDGPTIVVPGSPPEWKNKATPYQVPRDVGTVFIDQNGYWLPSSRSAPLFAAVNMHVKQQKKPPFDWSTVDIITDRNALRKLMRWIDGRADREFRIDLQLSSDGTVLFNRWEKRTQDVASGFTFGYNFEKDSTTPASGCDGSTGHHRIVQYDMNGLNMVVRFEVDACLPSAPKSPSVSSRRRISTDSSSIDALSASLASASIKATETPTAVLSIGDKTLSIIKGGQEVPQGSIIELSTISEKRLPQYTWDESFPQLFVSQTPHFFLGVHQNGHFIEVQKRKLSSTELADKAKQYQSRLKKLRQALEKIVDLALEHGEQGRLSLVCRDGKMELYQRNADDEIDFETLMNLLV